MPKVSIIIPAYNVENYIFRAIESGLNQTEPDVEVMIVDDGSTDGTWEVMERYMRTDHRVVAVRQENRGVSSARNHGLTLASGEYVVFLDADDWLETHTVKTLLTLAQTAPDKLPCASYYDVSIDPAGGSSKTRQRPEDIVREVLLEDALQNTGTGKYSLQSSCFKLFRSQIIKSQHLTFQEKYHHGEDGLFVFHYLRHCSGLVFSAEPLWNILDRPGSATTAPYNDKWLTAVDAVEEMLHSEGLSEGVHKELLRYTVSRIETVMHAALLTGAEHDNAILSLRKKLMNYRKAYFSQPRGVKEWRKFVIYGYLPIPVGRWFVRTVRAWKQR